MLIKGASEQDFLGDEGGMFCALVDLRAVVFSLAVRARILGLLFVAQRDTEHSKT